VRVAAGCQIFDGPHLRDRGGLRGNQGHVARGLSSCAEYNKISFDPAYENEPLATFEPMAAPRAREALVLPSRNLALTRAR